MPKSEPTTRPAFWRCNRCGTPNPWAVYLTACLGCGAPMVEAAATSRPTETEAPSRVRRAAAPVLLGLVLGYGLVLIGVYILLRGVGDAWWPGALLMLSPRVVFLVPILPLAVWAVRARRWRIAAALAIEAAFVLGPLMGFVVPIGRESAQPGTPTIRIMTFNRGSGTVDSEAFFRYLDRSRIDVLCLQEAPVDRADPLADRLRARGWSVDHRRVVASRLPIVAELPRQADENRDLNRYTGNLDRVQLRSPEGREFVVGSLHMPTLRPGMLALLRGDFASCRALLDWWNVELERLIGVANESGGLPILLAGDLNQGPEASRLLALRGSGEWRSAFDEAGIGWGYTRPVGFAWARIDHILVGEGWAIRSCWVGPHFGSDHRSMIAEVAFPPSPPARP